MTERQARRITGDLTAAERAHACSSLRDQIAAELPDMTAPEPAAQGGPRGSHAERRPAACGPRQPDVPVRHRQAGRDRSDRVGRVPDRRAATLRSDVLDRLAGILGYDLGAWLRGEETWKPTNMNHWSRRDTLAKRLALGALPARAPCPVLRPSRLPRRGTRRSGRRWTCWCAAAGRRALPRR